MVVLQFIPGSTPSGAHRSGVTYPSGRYKGTTFGGASVEVTLLTAKTQQACTSPGKYEVSSSPDAEFQIDVKSPSRVIGGTSFLHSSERGAAMSNDIATDRYRGFKNGRCYELALHITFTNFRAYDPGAIREFTRHDEEQVTRQLRQILDSFRSLH